LITAGDVLHSFAMPSLGVKKDAVPGRLNETWMKIEKKGMYRGQCSEICGTGHGYMPIVIEAVSQEEFLVWIENTKNKFAMLDKSTLALLTAGK
jgi:cytochrome c oxidase subunit II